MDGVICGHIHVAAIRDVHGICYVNCGDWVDSCTAIVEHAGGRLELVRWGAAHPVVAPAHALRSEPALGLARTLEQNGEETVESAGA